MKPIVVLAASALAFAATTASAQETQSPATEAPATAAPADTVVTPESFVIMAASSSALEIESSQLARERSQDEAVQAFAQQMIDDHTAATEALTAAAEAEGMPVPDGLDPLHQEMLDELQQAEVDAFDERYIIMQREAHLAAITLHENFAEESEGGALSEFAADALPVLEEHLQMVEELDSK